MTFTWSNETTIIAIFTAVCVVITAILLSGKGDGLIAGYNMLSKEKKAKIDTPKFCRFIGKVMAFVTISMILILAGMVTGIIWINVLAIITLVISVVIGFIRGSFYYMAPTRK